MDLRAYISTWPRNERRRVLQVIADHFGVTEAAVRHWVNGIRRIPAEHVLAVEHLTGGQVTRYEQRPDIYPPET